DLDDAPVTDADIGLARRGTGAVDDIATANDGVEHHDLLARLALRVVHCLTALGLGREPGFALAHLRGALGFLRGAALLALGLELFLVEDVRRCLELRL